MLVQPGAPNHLLLGTDTQPKLGFSLVAESEETSIDLLTGKERIGNQLPRATATQSDGQPPNLRCPVPEDFPGQQMSAAQLAGRGQPEMKDGVVAVPPELQSQDGVIESSRVEPSGGPDNPLESPAAVRVPEEEPTDSRSSAGGPPVLDDIASRQEDSRTFRPIARTSHCHPQRHLSTVIPRPD